MGREWLELTAILALTPMTKPFGNSKSEIQGLGLSVFLFVQ
jgi:hypothetical protein